MRLSTSTLTLLSILTQTQVTNAVMFDCKRVLADGVKFDLSELGGYHQVSWIHPHGVGYYNETFKMDICKSLKFEDKEEKLACKEGTHICGIQNFHHDDDFTHEITYPIWREYIHDGSRSEPKYTRLKSGEGNQESQQEGVRVVIGGGLRDKVPQSAVIEFICPKKDSQRLKRTADDEDDEPNNGNDPENHPDWEAAKSTDDGAGGRIEFHSYEKDTLRLNWFTPHGCEDSAKPGDSSGGGGWGFFSWFFFIIFMLLLAYLLFSAWINYTRNGARGWDLLPHSDTIRDVPYIVGDFGRKIVSTMNGGGSRGGYSAV